MKIIILSILLTSVFISTNAFATHAYRSEHCKSATHELFYKGNYPIGGDYGMTLANQENELIALPSVIDETQTSLEDADIVFNESDYKILEQAPTTNDCYFEHDEWKTEKVIEISLIKDDAAKILGLKQGDKMTFICEETSDYPNGNNGEGPACE